MAYASQTEIQTAAGGAAAFVQLADWDADGVPDAAVIADAQTRGDGWIDGYLRMRFATPIANPSATLRLLAADEAVYQIRRMRPGGLTPDDVNEKKARGDELEKYRKGELRPDEPLPQKSTAVKSAIIELGGEITRDGTKGMW